MDTTWLPVNRLRLIGSLDVLSVLFELERIGMGANELAAFGLPLAVVTFVTCRVVRP